MRVAGLVQLQRRQRRVLVQVRVQRRVGQHREQRPGVPRCQRFQVQARAVQRWVQAGGGVHGKTHDSRAWLWREQVHEVSRLPDSARTVVRAIPVDPASPQESPLPHKPTVLVVDDEPLNVSLLSQLLRPEFRVLGALSGQSALALMAAERPDLVLLDVMMPVMDGLTVLGRMQADPALADIPVIFVTALGAEFDEEKGLALGAADYIVKPIKPAVLLARVRAHLALRQARQRLADQNAWLEHELARRIRDGLLAQDLMLCAMAELAETRDDDTGNHIQRTRLYVELLARQLQHGPSAAHRLDEAQLQRIVKAAPMHDLGKIGIPTASCSSPAG
jgi:response regulator RpfG family c-di-GMP phosphodiesterase